jgi:hypothetical protein
MKHKRPRRNEENEGKPEALFISYSSSLRFLRFFVVLFSCRKQTQQWPLNA